MNKKLLAIAIGSALAGAPMFANAAATMYGAVHLSIDNLDNGATTNGTLMTLSSNSSFVGIKADEDLGGGLKAIMGAEWQMAFDAAANGLANRNVFVGLQGGFGTVKLGQIDDITKQVGRKVDLFHNEQLGESRAVTRQNYGFIGGSSRGQDERLANSINYESPKLGPVTLTANYSMANSNNATGFADTTAMALGAQLNMGGLYVGAAWKDQQITVTGPAMVDITSMRLVGSYDFNFGLKLAGFYQTVDYDGFEQSTMGVGVAYKIGNATIKGQYYIVDSFDLDITSTTGATLTAIGVDYNLSKNTFVYATYAAVDNDDNAAFSVIGAGHSNPNDATTGMPNNSVTAWSGAGNDPKGFSIGMKMKF